MTFRDIFGKILEEKSEQEDITVRESIARSITQKAAGGDISAVKFLRELVDEDEIPEQDTISEVRIHVLD